MTNTWRSLIRAFLGFLILVFGEAIAADDFESKVPEPPHPFTGTAPVNNGSLVPLKDGRLMMVGSGTRVSYSKDGGRSWIPSQPLAVKGKPLSGDGDPTSLIRLKSGKLALLYGRAAHAVGAPPGHDLFLRTSDDEGGTWTPISSRAMCSSRSGSGKDFD